MRHLWIIVILPILLSMGLLIVVIGQHQVMDRFDKRTDNLRAELGQLYIRCVEQELVKISLENLLARGINALRDMKIAVIRLESEIEKKKSESETCQEEEKTRKEELGYIQQSFSEMKVNLERDSGAWKQEISTLKTQLTEYRPICDHVKKDTQAVKLCGTKTNSTEEKSNV
ncbi:uncharacterized protein [Embiotoca jacksoni]|uniref:uncharacterized protein n=1 Tax=Embiotoca jacksoni TaxID=100190 RepID=UPI0037041284